MHPPSDVTSVNDPAGISRETCIKFRRVLRQHANLYGYVTSLRTLGKSRCRSHFIFITLFMIGYACIIKNWVTKLG